MTTMEPIFVARSYEDLRQGLIMRRKQLGFSQIHVDALAGLADGHTGKIEAGARVKNLGPLSLTLLMGALGLKLIAVSAASTEGDEFSEKLRLFKALCRARSAKAARIRIARMTPHQRRKMTLAARQARWRKGKRTEVRP